MPKTKICGALPIVLLLCLQPYSYSAESVRGNEKAVAYDDPILDASGNLLFFKIVFSKTTGVGTDVTLISPGAQIATETYTGIFSLIQRGEQAVYAIQMAPPASPTAANSVPLNLVALVTTNKGGLPPLPVEYLLPNGSIDLLKVDRGVASDVIYVIQKASSGASVLIFTFDGTALTLLGMVPVS